MPVEKVSIVCEGFLNQYYVKPHLAEQIFRSTCLLREVSHESRLN